METGAVDLADQHIPFVSRPLRVLHVIPGKRAGIGMIFAKRQVASLSEEGVENFSVYLTSRTSPMVLLRVWFELRKAIKDFQPDIVHAHYGTVTGLFTALSTSCPLVISYRGGDLVANYGRLWLRSALQKMLSNLAALRARRIICVTKEVRNRLWWRRTIAAVIPSGVNLEFFLPRPLSEARKALGWGPEQKVVVFYATPTAEKIKRLHLAQAAVTEAEKLIGSIHFVHLKGDTDPSQVPIIMSAANCLLVTAAYDGSPNVVKEALACNLPVVSVDVGDVRERLQGVAPSAIVKDTPHDIVQALVKILHSPRRSNGRAAVVDLATERIAERILYVYKSALGAEV